MAWTVTTLANVHTGDVTYLGIMVEGIQILAVLVSLVPVFLLGLGLVRVFAGIKLFYLQCVLEAFKLVGELDELWHVVPHVFLGIRIR